MIGLLLWVVGRLEAGMGAALLKIAAATGVMAVTVWGVSGWLAAGWLAEPGRLNDLLLLGLAGGSGLAVYAAGLTLLRLPEAREIGGFVARKAGRR
jgi:hypothetical protein